MDLYKLLGVTRKANAEKITTAYRKLAFELHPDRNPGDVHAASRFREVQLAYEVLTNPERRAAYDSTGSTVPPAEIANKAQMLLNEALAFVFEASASGMYSGTVNIRDKMKTLMVNKLSEIKSQVKTFQSKRKKLEDLAGRFERTDDGENALDAAIRAKVWDAVEMERRLQGDELAMTKALEELENYTYRVPTQNVKPANDADVRKFLTAAQIIVQQYTAS